MAIDTTQRLKLSSTPVEIVATLGLVNGEYRIENSEPPTSNARIYFVAAASAPVFNPDLADRQAAHVLVAGAREDIGIETGQKWYFWSGAAGATLVITRSEAGGAIGGSPPVIPQPSFHVDIFRAYDSVADIPAEAPVGGTYNLDTAQLTPPNGWFASQRRLTGNQVEAHSRAIINPNTLDRLLTPIWSIPQQVNLIGTITGIATDPPLQGGANAGQVTLGVQTRGIGNDSLATDSVDLRTLDGGTAGRYIGFDAQGAAAEIIPPERIEQFDVPAYSSAMDDQVLTVQSGGLAWSDKTPPAPRDIEFFYGVTVPTPEGHEDIWFATGDASGLSGITDSDGTTARSRIRRGDVYEYDSTAGALGNGAWVYRGNMDTAYANATTTVAGLMSAADKTKLDGVEAEAEVNVQANWSEGNTDSDAYIRNKPVIPPAPVQSDWDETDATLQAFIQNKPTAISEFDVPAYPSVDGRVLGVHSGSLAWLATGRFQLFFGTDFPANALTGSHLFFTGLATGLTNYTESDTTTARTEAIPGDIAEYDGTRWVYQGAVNTEYPFATASTGGIMTDDQAVKLAGIEVGANVNEQADWTETDRRSDAYIANKPTIPTVPGNATTRAAGLMSADDKTKLNGIEAGAESNVESDWEATSGDAFIRNKPTIPDVPSHPAAGATAAVYELQVATDGTPTWVTAFVPKVDGISVGGSLPASPSVGDWHFQTAAQTSGVPANVRQTDGTTARTALVKGDIYRFATERMENVWILEGNTDTAPGLATAAAAGLLSNADFTKLMGIEAGAEVNVNADWDAASGDAQIQNKPTTISDFDVPSYSGNDGMVLGLVAGNPAWVSEPVPNVPVLSVGGTLPASPATNDQHIMSANVTSGVPSNVRQTDGTTARTRLGIGDVYRYDGTNWILQGNIDTVYPLASASVDGLLSTQLFSKLAGIEEGAEVNVQADWAQTNSTADSYIDNKPTIPAAQVPSDWDATGGVERILNKPTALTDFGLPTFGADENGQILGVRGGALVWRDEDNPRIPDIHVSPTRPAIARANELWFATADITTNVPTNIIGSDGNPVTAVSRGQVFRFDETNWDLQGSLSDSSGLPNTPSATMTDQQYNLQVAMDGTVSWEQDTGGGTGGGEDNVQANWDETDTASDAFIRNKPTIPTSPGLATSSTDGLMSNTDFSKLAGIEEGAEENVQADWDATSGDARILNKPTIPTVPGDATGAASGLMSAADKTKLDGIEARAEVNVNADWNATRGAAVIENKPTIPDLPTAPSATATDLQYNLQVTTDGTTTWEQDTGGGTGGGEDNVQADWDETDTASDAYIQNKPTIPAAQVASDWNATSGIARILNKPTIPTIPGNATTTEAGLMSDTDKTKLDGVETGAEVNVNADWDATSGDAQILNKPDLAGRFMGDFAIRTAYAKGDVVFSTGQFWRAKQDVPDDRVGAPTNDLDYWQQETFSIGIASSLPTFADDDEFDLNRDRWIILSADETLTGTRDGTGALPYVADIQDTGDRTLAEITNNQLTSLNRGDIMRVDTWPTRYWARMVNAERGGGGGGAGTVSTDATLTGDGSSGSALSVANPFTAADETKLDGIAAGAEVNVQADWTETDTADDAYIANKPGNATDTTPGLMSNLDKAKLDTITTGAETNVQADWNQTNTTNDAFIRNKPTIPTLPGNATDTTAGLMSGLDKAKLDTIAQNAEVNVQADWDTTNTTNDSYIQNKPSDAEFGDKAFSNPPTDLTTTEQAAVRSAIGAGTGGSTTVAGFGTEEVASVNLDSSGGYNWIATTSIEIPAGDWWLVNAGYSADARWIVILTDDIRAVTASSGTGASATGEYIEINGVGGRMRLGRDSSNMLRVATQRNVDDPTPLRIRRILPNSGSNTVTTDATISGDGGTATPLSVANPFTAADETKLDGIATGAEVNVQADWTETDTSSDAYIANKPSIPTVPGNATTAAAGLMSSADKTKLDGIESGAEVNVNADWNANSGDALIANKPTIPDLPSKPSNPSSQTDYNLRLTTAGAASWVEDTGGGGGGGASTFTGLTDTPASYGTAGQFIRINSAADGLEFTAAPSGGGTTLPTGGTDGQLLARDGTTGLEWVDAPAGGGGGGWEQIGSTWDSAGANLATWKDTGIQLPSSLVVGDIYLVTVGNRTARSRSGSFVFNGDMMQDLTDATVDGSLNTTAPAANRLAFDHGDQTDAEYFIGKSSTGSLLFATESNTSNNLDISLYRAGGGSGGGGGSSTFVGLTDTPSALGSAGQILQVNAAGTALEFVAAPTGGGPAAMSQYLPPPDERSTDGGFFYMGWEDNFSSSWGIRRVSLVTGEAATATMTNNTVYANLTAAWAVRTMLTYA